MTAKTKTTTKITIIIIILILCTSNKSNCKLYYLYRYINIVYNQRCRGSYLKECRLLNETRHWNLRTEECLKIKSLIYI